jgi:hypothetical protein
MPRCLRGDGCAWRGAWRRTGGRCAGPPNGSRSPDDRRPVGGPVSAGRCGRQGRPHRTCFQYTARDSEFLKYMENAYLATKVTFVTEFRRTCETLGADWPTVREGWLLGPRIEPAHTAALAHAPGFSGKCLSKDLHAIIQAATGAPGHGDAPRGRCRCAARRSRQARPMESSPSPAAGRRKRCSDVCHAGSLHALKKSGRSTGSCSGPYAGRTTASDCPEGDRYEAMPTATQLARHHAQHPLRRRRLLQRVPLRQARRYVTRPRRWYVNFELPLARHGVRTGNKDPANRRPGPWCPGTGRHQARS